MQQLLICLATKALSKFFLKPISGEKRDRKCSSFLILIIPLHSALQRAFFSLNQCLVQDTLQIYRFLILFHVSCRKRVRQQKKKVRSRHFSYSQFCTLQFLNWPAPPAHHCCTGVPFPFKIITKSIHFSMKLFLDLVFLKNPFVAVLCSYILLKKCFHKDCDS